QSALDAVLQVPSDARRGGAVAGHPLPGATVCAPRTSSEPRNRKAELMTLTGATDIELHAAVRRAGHLDAAAAMKRIVLALALLPAAAPSASADEPWVLWRHRREWKPKVSRYDTVDWTRYNTYAARKQCRADMEAMAEKLFDSLNTKQKRWDTAPVVGH